MGAICGFLTSFFKKSNTQWLLCRLWLYRVLYFFKMLQQLLVSFTEAGELLNNTFFC